MPKRTFNVTASKGAFLRQDGRKGMSDSVDVQLSVTVNVPRGKTLAREVIEQAIKYKATTGDDPPGFKIRIIRWRNPDRSGSDSPETIYKNPEDAELQPGWREYGKQSERFGTLARSLRSSRMVYTVKRSLKRGMVAKKAKHRKAGRKTARKKASNRRGPRKTRRRR